MLKLPKDRTIPLIIWTILLSCVSIIIAEDLPNVVSESPVAVNLKAAKLEDIMMIPRMNIRVAKRIFEMRDQLKSWEDLRGVRGVGPKTLEQLKGHFVLN